MISWLLLAQLAGAESQSPAKGAPYALPRAEVLTLKRADVSEELVLYVSVPKGYEGSDQHYPVVFLLDPDYAFPIAHSVVEHFVDRNDLPPMILVGVGYPGKSQDVPTYRRHRTRDYTPTHSLSGGYSREIQEHSGGGPAFREVLTDEVIPWIESRYRTTGDRTLVGHSYGGLFATFVLLTRPATFERYLIVSPSYWYDDRFIFELEARVAQQSAALSGRVALYVGARENPPHTRTPMVSNLRKFARQLRGRRYERLTVVTKVFPDETHNSVFPAALTRGIRWLFEPD